MAQIRLQFFARLWPVSDLFSRNYTDQIFLSVSEATWICGPIRIQSFQSKHLMH